MNGIQTMIYNIYIKQDPSSHGALSSIGLQFLKGLLKCQYMRIYWWFANSIYISVLVCKLSILFRAAAAAVKACQQAHVATAGTRRMFGIQVEFLVPFSFIAVTLHLTGHVAARRVPRNLTLRPVLNIYYPFSTLMRQL